MSALWERIPHGIRPEFPGMLLTPRAYKWNAQDKTRPTSYMDGIRGFAAFLVVIHHWTDMDFVHTTSNHGYWNYDDPNRDREIWRLPIIRLLYQGGHAVVPIFFVISGFSLAYKPIEYIRAKKFDKVLINLSSSLIRRAPRLCLPPIVMTFFVFLAIRLGWYDNRPLPQPVLERFPTFWEQLKDWYWDVTYMPDPFSWDFVIWIKYQPHTWTLNTELHGSKWVYLTILATCTLREKPRLIVLCWWCLYCLWHIKYWTFLFCSGIVIAEVHHHMAFEEQKIRREGSLYRPLQNSDPGTSSVIMEDTPLTELSKENGEGGLQAEAYPTTASSSVLGESEGYVMYILLLVGLFLCSVPDDEAQSKYMFWRTLWRWCPVPVPNYDPFGSNQHDYHEKIKRIYLSMGSVMVVFAISRLGKLRKFFEIPAMQYLGKVSFSLYLIHGPVIMVVGWATLPAFWYWFNVGTYWPPAQWDGISPLPIYKDASRFLIEVAHWMCLACMLPCMFWGADLFTKFVDEPILLMTKKVFDRFAVQL